MNYVDAFKAALPTSRHAEMLIELVIESLGPMCVIETAGGGKRICVFVRDRIDPEWMVPWPILEWARGSRIGYVAGEDGVPIGETPPARDGEPPRLRGLTSGELNLSDGIHKLTLTYGQDGLLAETTKPNIENFLPSAVHAVEHGKGQPTELLAESLARTDIGNVWHGRVRYTIGCGRTAFGAWIQALGAFREAMLERGLNRNEPWIAADGYAGSVLRASRNRNDAILRCEEGIRESRPQIPESKSRFTQEELNQLALQGYITISAPVADAPRLQPSVELTPIALTKLTELPVGPPPFGEWTRLLDDRGGSIPAALLREGKGILIATEPALKRVPDINDLRLLMDDADGRYDLISPKAEWLPPLPKLTSDARTYVFHSEEGEPPRLRVTGCSSSPLFQGRIIQADRVAGGAFRQRPID